MNPLLLIPIGLAFFVVYFLVFRIIIIKMDLKTVGREDDDNAAEMKIELSNSNYAELAKALLAAVGGAGNIKTVDNCITRLRLEVKDILVMLLCVTIGVLVLYMNIKKGWFDTTFVWDLLTK